jgi:hypothetical protein
MFSMYLGMPKVAYRKGLRPVLSQNYFGTILRYYFLAGAEIVPRNGLCDRKKKNCFSTIFC